MKKITVFVLSFLCASYVSRAAADVGVSNAIWNAQRTATTLPGAPIGQSRKFIFEYNLASVRVGLSPDHVPLGYKFVILAAISTPTAPQQEAELRRSIPRLVKTYAAAVRTGMDA